jgi:hypothetical protein
MTEEWKDIEGYENLYQVSNLGRVKSLERYEESNSFIGVRRRGERILKPIIKPSGYLQVALSKNSKAKTFTVHRLVAQAFIPNPENKPCIDHVNTNPSDNRLENLRWCTHKENSNNPLTVQKWCGNPRMKTWLGKLGKEHHSSKPIIQFTLDGELVRKWDCAEDAVREMGYSKTCISQVLNKKRQQTGGSKWEYYNTDRYLIALMNKTIKDREQKRTA